MPDRRPLAVVIMAAGKGTRMNNPSMAKVMFPVGDLPMIHHVVQLALDCDAERIIAIIGYNRESVREYLDRAFPGRMEYAEQVEQLGTGHAVMQAAPLLEGFDGDVLVLSGDVPLLGRRSVDALAELHRRREATATVLTVIAPDPTGYGRVIRNADRSVARIVEQRDASEEERAVAEINSGIYLFRAPDLIEALSHLRSDNAQGEYYLTDVFGWFASEGRAIAAYTSEDFTEIQGINTVANLEEVNREFSRRRMTEA
jgi:UDP-N-acetylglucosamine diphosphorylase/glucosamine-1-phosphate N-acetyltransferase